MYSIEYKLYSQTSTLSFNIQSKMAPESSQFVRMILGNKSFAKMSMYINLFNISFNMAFHLAKGEIQV